jgi:molybdopterin converting factor small subunit
MIEVRLFATLRAGREKVTSFSPDEARDGHSVLARLAIGEEEVAIFLINGRHSTLSVPLEDGDVVAIFPAVGGG